MESVSITFNFANPTLAAAFLAFASHPNSGNPPPVTTVRAVQPPTPAPTPVVSASTSAPAPAPAPVAAGASEIDPFGDATPAAPGMTASEFGDKLKAECGKGDVAANRVKLTNFLKTKGASSVGMLVAGLTDEQRGVLFGEALAALR